MKIVFEVVCWTLLCPRENLKGKIVGAIFEESVELLGGLENKIGETTIISYIISWGNLPLFPKILKNNLFMNG